MLRSILPTSFVSATFLAGISVIIFSFFSPKVGLAFDFVESPQILRGSLEWHNSSTSMQAMLYHAFSNYAESEHASEDGSFNLRRTRNGFFLSDNESSMSCESRVRPSQQASNESAQETEYRCEFTLPSAVLDWSSYRSAVQAQLFYALKTYAATQVDRIPSIEEQEGLTYISLPDSESASMIECQRKNESGIFHYRCRILLRP